MPTTAVVPKPDTLAKYGMTAEDWLAILEKQGGVCAICGKCPSSGRFNVDHQHVGPGGHWKKLPPHRRRERVRGLLCWTCNHLCVGRGVTVAKLKAAAAYLERFASR